MAQYSDSEELVLRRMRVTDLDSVVYVEERAYEFGWRRSTFLSCIEQKNECWVFVDPQMSDAFTVGHAVLSYVQDFAELLNLTIEPSRHRHGLGRAMLEHLLGRARALGARRVLLERRETNEAAEGLYGSLGFKQIGVRKNYYETKRGRENAIVMALPIYTDSHSLM